MNRSPLSQPSDAATDGSPVNAAGVRTAATTQTAATTVSAACVQTSSRRPPASNSGPPESTATSTPANSATLPTEMAAVRSSGGKYRAAIFVIEFRHQRLAGRDHDTARRAPSRTTSGRPAAPGRRRR